MNEEQQKIVDQTLTKYLEPQGLFGVFDDMLHSALNELRRKELLPEEQHEDKREFGKIVTEIEKLAARAMIQASVKFLQNRQEAFPEHASPKLAVVEIEYDTEEHDEDEDYTFKGIFVRKVVVDGKEVQRDYPMSPFVPTSNWLLVEHEDATLELKHDPN